MCSPCIRAVAGLITCLDLTRSSNQGWRGASPRSKRNGGSGGLSALMPGGLIDECIKLTREDGGQPLSAECLQSLGIRGQGTQTTGHPGSIGGDQGVAQGMRISRLHDPAPARVAQDLRGGALRHQRKNRSSRPKVFEEFGGHEIDGVWRGLEEQQYARPTLLEQRILIGETRP